MIDYGLYPAMRSILESYVHHSRRSGRTGAMVKNLGKGDLVIFHTEEERRRVEYIARRALSPEIYASISFIVSNDCDLCKIAARRRPAGAVVFDHGWVEHYFRTNLHSANVMLQAFVDFGGKDHSDTNPWGHLWGRSNANFD